MDLRAFARLGRERTDEEIAAEEPGGDDLVALTGDTWEVLERGNLAAELLDVAETSGMAGATAWHDARDLTWTPATPPPRRDQRDEVSPQTRREARAVLRDQRRWVRDSAPSTADPDK